MGIIPGTEISVKGLAPFGDPMELLVKDLVGGMGMRQRLTEMGLVRGTEIRVIKNDLGGPMIISIGEERLAIGRGMLLKIMVEEAR